jgi:hypothetical protein
MACKWEPSNSRENDMKRYEPETPRAAVAVTAVVMTLATASVMVVAPATIQTDADREALVARMQAPATEVTINPARIDVVATRESGNTWKQASR